MIAWTTPGINTLANRAGLRRGMHFLEVNGQDVGEAPTPKSAMLAIAKAGFPATLLFRPAPNDTDELSRLCQNRNIVKSRAKTVPREARKKNTTDPL